MSLLDFGASTTLSQFDKTQETTTIKGTPYFMAPEVLASSSYGRKGDIWAVGCTIIQVGILISIDNTIILMSSYLSDANRRTTLERSQLEGVSSAAFAAAVVGNGSSTLQNNH